MSTKVISAALPQTIPSSREKRSLKDLAVLGGAPLFSEALHVGRPNIADQTAFYRRLEGVFERGWFTNRGPLVQEFEERVAEFVGVRHCIAVCNATQGLQLLLQAAGIEGEVIMPSFTFVATAHAARMVGLDPLFCDVAAHNHLLDPDLVEACISSKTAAILAVHLWGQSAEVERLSDIAERHGLFLAFDAAHAFACGRGSRRIGSFGRAEVFSFHATKFVHSFEGGMIATNEDLLAEKLRLAINFGFRDYDSVGQLGTNAKMTEACAAMGLASLDSIEQIRRRNLENLEAYRRELQDTLGVRILEFDSGVEHNYQYVVLEVDQRTAGLSRDQLLKVLHSENVLARRYFYPGCHHMEPYRSESAHGPQLPVTEALAKRVLVLPTGLAVTPSTARQVARLIRISLRESDRLAKIVLVADNDPGRA